MRTPSLYDQRVRIYRAEDSGAEGFVRPVYRFTVERWGRLDDTADAETVPLAPQGHVEYRIDAALTVADSTDLPRNGIVLLGGALYYIRGVVLNRQLRVNRAVLERIDPTAYETFTTIDTPSTLDGEHAINPG